MLRIKIGNLAIDKYRPAIKKHSYPLLFIPGAGGTSRYLKNYLLFFSRAGWRGYAINLRGHSPSDREATLAQMTIEDYIDDVERVMRVLGIEDCVLLGHSMGGLIALKTAMHFKSIKAVVTIASAPPLGVPLEMNSSLPYSGAIIKSVWGLLNLKPVKMSYFMAEKSVLNNIDEAERKKIFSMFVAESFLVGFQMIQGVSVDKDQIKCPKLVIGCQRDAIAPASMQQNLAKFLRADYISYEQFAHLPMLEKGWEQSALDIGKWLKSNVPEEKQNGKG